MSNIYNLEPPTKGKVVLKTTLGDLDIELWGKEAPKAVRNFVQLCMEGYYDNTLFHRVMKGYLVQGGDPTGTGQGGESTYGEMFKDEFHSRLKFTHRGLVACANQNEPNTNASQFFITLDKTEWLNKKNTIFGRISGESIYNLLRIADLDVDADDRPVDPPRILEAEILWNPFEDIVLRGDAKAEREEAEARRSAAEAAKKRASRPTSKNLTLLSFGDEAEDEEEQLAVAAASQAAAGIRIRSAHDVLKDDRLARPEETPDDEIIVVSERAIRKPKTSEEKKKAAHADSEAVRKTKEAFERARAKNKAAGSSGRDGGGRADADGDGGNDDEDEAELASRQKWGQGTDIGFAAAMHAQAIDRRKAMGDERHAAKRGDADDKGIDEEGDGARAGSKSAARQPAGDEEGEEEDEVDGLTALERKNQKYADKGPFAGRVRAVTDDVADADLLKPYQLTREKYKQHKRVMGDREKDTMARLAKFTSTLKSFSSGGVSKKDASAAADATATAEGADVPKASIGEAGYSGKVSKDIDHNSYLPAAWRVDDYLDRDELDASLEELKNHKLKFSNPSGRTDTMERVDNLDDYVVYDPLLEKGKGKFSKAENDKKKRKTEWAGKPNM